jgi:hypothetical protein
MMKLKNKPDLTVSKLGEVLFVQGINVFSLIENLSRSRTVKRAQDVEKGRLSHAPGAIENENLAGLNHFTKIVCALDHGISLPQVHRFVKIYGVILHKFINKI